MQYCVYLIRNTSLPRVARMRVCAMGIRSSVEGVLLRGAGGTGLGCVPLHVRGYYTVVVTVAVSCWRRGEGCFFGVLRS